MPRPRTASGTLVDSRWLAHRSRNWSSHHSDIWVSTTPLSGTGVLSTWSYAEMRSEATRSIRCSCAKPVSGSSGAYNSRTLPA